MKVKSILVSQPKPQAENSPYYEIEKRNKIKIETNAGNRFIEFEKCELL